MENKDELEVDMKNGADSKDKKTSEEELYNLNEQIEDLKEQGVDVDKIQDKMKENILKEIDDEEDEIRKHWNMAYDRLDDETKKLITEDDINEIVEKQLKGQKIDTSRPELQKLQEERNKVLQEEGDKLFLDMKKNLGLDMKDAENKWNNFKRAFLISFIFGIPGALLLIAKDLYDQNKVKKQIGECVKKYIDTKDARCLDDIKKIVKENFGRVVDVNTFGNYICETELIPLLSNDKALKNTMINFFSTEQEKIENTFDTFFKENEEQKDEEADEEDEDDPEPVEGMKYFM